MGGKKTFQKQFLKFKNIEAKKKKKNRKLRPTTLILSDFFFVFRFVIMKKKINK